MFGCNLKNLKQHITGIILLFFMITNVTVYAFEFPIFSTFKEEKIAQTSEKSQKVIPTAPSPYGIKLGITTEDEIRSKYTVEQEIIIDENGRSIDSHSDPFFQLFSLGVNQPDMISIPGMRILILDKKPFSKIDLPIKRISIGFDENKKVNFVSIVYEGKMFDFLNRTLSEKYKVFEDKSKKIFNPYIIMGETSSWTMIGLFKLIKLGFISTDSLTGSLSVINYCSGNLLENHAKWIKEKEKAIKNLL